MYTESTIVIRARKALAEGRTIDIRISEHIRSIKFRFKDGTVASSIEEWFSECVKRNVAEFKISEPIGDEKDFVFGGVPYETEIVCIWKDGSSTRYILSKTREGGAEKLEFCEEDYSRDISNLVNINDNTDEFIANLKGLKKLAEKIGYKYYARTYDTACRLLEGTVEADYSGAPNYILDLPDRLKDIMLARNIAYVFGGMGSWNDDPMGVAEEMGLGDEYRRFTCGLKINLARSLFYVTNVCYE